MTELPKDIVLPGALMSLISRIKGANEKGLTVEGKAEALAQLDNLRAMLVSE